MSLIGRAGPEWQFAVEWTKVREFAIATRAPCTEGENMPVPLTFPIYATNAFGMLAELLYLDHRRLLHGEQEYEYRRPLRIGDRLLCRTQIVEDYRKEGKRGGAMRFIVLQTEMRDQESGEVVVIGRTTAIETGANRGRE